MVVDELDAAADAEAEARRRGKRPLSPAADRGATRVSRHVHVPFTARARLQ